VHQLRRRIKTPMGLAVSKAQIKKLSRVSDAYPKRDYSTPIRQSWRAWTSGEARSRQSRFAGTSVRAEIRRCATFFSCALSNLSRNGVRSRWNSTRPWHGANWSASPPLENQAATWPALITLSEIWVHPESVPARAVWPGWVILQVLNHAAGFRV